MNAHPLFELEFMPTSVEGARWLPSPPVFGLTPPDCGWIRLHVAHPDAGDFPYVWMSNVYPPLVNLYVWSNALALGMVPLRVRIDEEGNSLFLAAQAASDGRLHLSLKRTGDYDETEVIQHLAWHEDAQAFLDRWWAMWSAYFADPSLPWDEWEGELDEPWPELARDLAWQAPRARLPNPPPWPREALIARAFLSLSRFPYRTVRQSDLSLTHSLLDARSACKSAYFQQLALTAAWRAAVPDAPVPEDPVVQRVHELVNLCEVIEFMPHELPPDLAAAAARRTVLMQSAIELANALWRFRQTVESVVFAQMPIAEGVMFEDAKGRIGRVLRECYGRWVVCWEDGVITVEPDTWLRARAAWPWPVADAVPIVLPQTPIDRRILAFACDPQTAVRLICPCCGYPELEDESAEIEHCEICGWPILRLLNARPPALDDTVDADGDPWPCTLRDARAHFEAHGDAYPKVRLPDVQDWLDKFVREPLYAAKRRELIDDWEHWLADPARGERALPKSVWRRVARGQEGASDQE